MKINAGSNELLHVVNSSVWSVIKEIADSGEQEDPFYVFDLDDLVRKYHEFKIHLPRVEPHYGKLECVSLKSARKNFGTPPNKHIHAYFVKRSKTTIRVEGERVEEIYSPTRIALTMVHKDSLLELCFGIDMSRNEVKIGIMSPVLFTAMKCNDLPVVLKVLAALGSSFDCASEVEINKILALDVHPSKIVFANPCKPHNHIQCAADAGVSLMTFDNETELYKIQNLFPDARMVLRFRCDDTSAQCRLGNKFGCDAFEDGPRLLTLARQLRINVVGVCFHVGSGCRNPPIFKRAIATARSLFDIAATIGYNFNFLDIGGGFPGDKGDSLHEIASVVNAALDEFFPDPSVVRVIAEPGRYMVSSAFTLATRVHGKRSLLNTGSVHHMYYINEGLYGGFNCVAFDHAVVYPKALRPVLNDENLVLSSIRGPTCNGLDHVCDNVQLPELSEGDWIVFENMGAYTLSLTNMSNGLLMPLVHTIVNEEVWKQLKSSGSFLCDKSEPLE